MGQGELIVVVDNELAIQEITKVSLEIYGKRYSFEKPTLKPSTQ